MKKMLLLFYLTACCTLLSLSSWAAEQPAPQVVVSIKPLHSLISGVMQGVGEPQLLVKGGGSPHSYVLRPSEARALARADLIIWVGHQLESFLEKPLATLGRQARQMELSKELQPYLLPMRKGGGWERHTHRHKKAEHTEEPEGHHEDHAAHPAMSEQGGKNPHLWLDPLLAIRIVDLATAAISEIDPAHRTRYADNSTQLKMRLTKLHAELQTKLAPVRDIPYIVFHDAYQYFETAFGLHAVGSLTIDPERKPGARRILEIRQKIKQLNARCVFSEPQFEPRLVATVIEGSNAKTGILDPLGADLPNEPNSYFTLLNRLAENLIEGLRQSP